MRKDASARKWRPTAARTASPWRASAGLRPARQPQPGVGPDAAGSAAEPAPARRLAHTTAAAADATSMRASRDTVPPLRPRHLHLLVAKRLDGRRRLGVAPVVGQARG